MKKNGIFGGVVFVLLAALVIVSELGLIEGIGFWAIVFSVVFGAMLIKGLVKFDLTQILFAIAFLCIVWDKELGIEEITPWPVLFAALLGSIGFSLIFGKSKKKYYEKKYKQHKGVKMHFSGEKDRENGTIEHDYGDEINCEVKFGSTVKYVNSENLQRVSASVSFGSAAIYLDNAKAQSNEVLVNIDVSFGGIELYVPRDWNIINDMQCSFSGVDERGPKTGLNQVNVVLIGSASFAGIDISYV